MIAYPLSVRKLMDRDIGKLFDIVSEIEEILTRTQKGCLHRRIAIYASKDYPGIRTQAVCLACGKAIWYTELCGQQGLVFVEDEIRRCYPNAHITVISEESNAP